MIDPPPRDAGISPYLKKHRALMKRWLKEKLDALHREEERAFAQEGSTATYFDIAMMEAKRGNNALLRKLYPEFDDFEITPKKEKGRGKKHKDQMVGKWRPDVTVVLAARQAMLIKQIWRQTYGRRLFGYGDAEDYAAQLCGVPVNDVIQMLNSRPFKRMRKETKFPLRAR